MGSKNCICWNVRGLNSGAQRDVVRELIRAERLSLVCLQETTLDVINDFDVMQILGPGFDYVYLPTLHAIGGILVTWKSVVWSVSSASIRTFSVSIGIKLALGGPD
jgi:exonuclease III